MGTDITALRISARVSIPLSEIELTAIRAGGPGGQNVNKLSTAVQLRFDILASSLPDLYQQRLRMLRDRRISRDGVVVIKAQRFRTREQNREDALLRLQGLIQGVMADRKRRIPTKPTRASRQRRTDDKTRRGNLKRLRGKVVE